MSIKFICSCGKHLRARDEMAGRRSVCPQCGMPVGIPFLKPSHPGGALGHMTPAERLRNQGRVRKVEELVQERRLPEAAMRAQGPTPSSPDASRRITLSEELFPRPLDPTLVRLVVNPNERCWQLETHWYHCMLYPLRAWWLILPLAAALSLLCAGTMFLLPELLKFRDNPLGLILIAAPILLVAGILLGYASSLLEGALTSGLAGEFRYIRWPGRGVVLALKSCATWLICILAGPVLMVAASLGYWIYCGDPGFLDWFILAELNLAAVSYTFLALLAISRGGRLRDANPWRVALLVHRLDFRVLNVIFLASLLVLAHGTMGIVALSQLQRDAGLGWFLLITCWLGGLFLTTFLLRLVGLWCYRARI